MYKKVIVIGSAVLLVGSIVALLSGAFDTCKSPMIRKLQNSLPQANIQAHEFFAYNPELELLPSQSPEDDLITIAAHGYGSNKMVGTYVAKLAPLTGYVLTFNLPDHDYVTGNGHILRHGTIDEILPLAYAVKLATAAGAQRVNLYGFSVGGGVVINLLRMLHTSQYDANLADIGITLADKQAMLRAIDRGVVLLDAPLKSPEEVIEGSYATEERLMLAQRYRDNSLRPIDSLLALQGLNLRIILYFENPDDVIFNREDAEFIRRLEVANSLGTTQVVIGSNGGHVSVHKELWKKYLEMITKK